MTRRAVERFLALSCCALALQSCSEPSELPGDDDALGMIGQGVTSAGLAQPAYMPRSTDFAVRIMDEDDGTWKTVDVINDVNGYDYAHFELSGGSARIEVTDLDGSAISSYSISPTRDNIQGSVSGNKLTYTIGGPKYTIVWISGENDKLVLVADPVHTPPAASGTGVFNVMNYSGVRNDGNNIGNTTSGIQAAINDASAWSGGRGRVYVPAGEYVVGNLIIKPDVELYMAEGAAFRFVSNIEGDKYNYTYSTDWTGKGNGTRWIKVEPGAQNIKIWGRGTFDGNFPGRGNFYNNLLVLNNNSNVEIDGIILKNGTRWGTLVARSNDVRLKNVKFFQPIYGGGEDDAIDIIESQNVTLSNSIGISFDDPFSIKTYDYVEDYISFSGNHEPASNILIDNVIAWTGCHAFKLGQGSGQTISGVTFRNSVVFDAAHGISIHHKAGTGLMENSTWEGIDIQKIGSSNLGRSWLYMNVESTGTGPGNVRNMTLKDIRVRDFGTDSSPINGYNSANTVSGIFLRNIYVGPTGDGYFAQNEADARITRNAYVSNLQISQDGVRRFWDGDSMVVQGAGEWSSGNYKGNCGPGWAMTGMSQLGTTPLSGPHALRCKNYGSPFNDVQAATLPVSSPPQDVRRYARSGDWDHGYQKLECGANEYVSGVSQHPTGHWLSHVRCAQATMITNNCETRTLVTQDDCGEQTGDWDPGYAKAECGAGKVVVGISVTGGNVTSGGGKPRKILCCAR